MAKCPGASALYWQGEELLPVVAAGAIHSAVTEAKTTAPIKIKTSK